MKSLVCLVLRNELSVASGNIEGVLLTSVQLYCRPDDCDSVSHRAPRAVPLNPIPPVPYPRSPLPGPPSSRIPHIPVPKSLILFNSFLVDYRNCFFLFKDLVSLTVEFTIVMASVNICHTRLTLSPIVCCLNIMVILAYLCICVLVTSAECCAANRLSILFNR